MYVFKCGQYAKETKKGAVISAGSVMIRRNDIHINTLVVIVGHPVCVRVWLVKVSYVTISRSRSSARIRSQGSPPHDLTVAGRVVKNEAIAVELVPTAAVEVRHKHG